LFLAARVTKASQIELTLELEFRFFASLPSGRFVYWRQFTGL